MEAIDPVVDGMVMGAGRTDRIDPSSHHKISPILSLSSRRLLRALPHPPRAGESHCPFSLVKTSLGGTCPLLLPAPAPTSKKAKKTWRWITRTTSRLNLLLARGTHRPSPHNLPLKAISLCPLNHQHLTRPTRQPCKRNHPEHRILSHSPLLRVQRLRPPKPKQRCRRSTETPLTRPTRPLGLRSPRHGRGAWVDRRISLS